MVVVVVWGVVAPVVVVVTCVDVGLGPHLDSFILWSISLMVTGLGFFVVLCCGGVIGSLAVGGVGVGGGGIAVRSKYLVSLFILLVLGPVSCCWGLLLEAAVVVSSDTVGGCWGGGLGVS